MTKRESASTSVSASASSDKKTANRKKKTAVAAHARVVGKPKMTKEERRAKYTQIARDREQQKRERNVTCFGCRQKGHSVSHCPLAPSGLPSSSSTTATTTDCRICYKCGSSEHSLAKCPLRTKQNTSPSVGQHEELPYANCFVCKATGHLASTCPQNADKGIFIKGGACRQCGSKLHKAKDCPERPGAMDSDKRRHRDDDDEKEEDYSALLQGEGDEQVVVEQQQKEDLDLSAKQDSAKRKKSTLRVVKFSS